MTNIWEGGCLKRGTWTICRFRGWGLDRKKGLVFLMVGWCSKAHCIPLLLKNWPSPLPILTTETAYQTFMKLWKYCNIPVKFANKQYNRQMILHETWSTNDIIIYCKSVNLFYKLNFLIFFSFKSFPFPLFTTPPFLAFLHTLNFCILVLIAHFGEVLALPFTEGGWRCYIIYKINPEISKIDNFS